MKIFLSAFFTLVFTITAFNLSGSDKIYRIERNEGLSVPKRDYSFSGQLRHDVEVRPAFSAVYNDDGIKLQFIIGNGEELSKKKNEYELRFTLTCMGTAPYDFFAKIPNFAPVRKYNASLSSTYPGLLNSMGKIIEGASDYLVEYFIPWSDIQTILPFSETGKGKDLRLLITIKAEGSVGWDGILKFPDIEKQKMADIWFAIAVQNCENPLRLLPESGNKSSFTSVERNIKSELAGVMAQLLELPPNDMDSIKKLAEKSRDMRIARKLLINSKQLIKSNTLKLKKDQSFELNYIFQDDHNGNVFLMNFNIKESKIPDLRITIINGTRTILPETDTGLLPNNFRIHETKKNDKLTIRFTSKKDDMEISPSFTIEEFLHGLLTPMPTKEFNDDATQRNLEK